MSLGSRTLAVTLVAASLTVGCGAHELGPAPRPGAGTDREDWTVAVRAQEPGEWRLLVTTGLLPRVVLAHLRTDGNQVRVSLDVHEGESSAVGVGRCVLLQLPSSMANLSPAPDHPTSAPSEDPAADRRRLRNKHDCTRVHVVRG